MHEGKPNILVIWGDDMGYRTPNIDRIANQGLAAFISGQSVYRTGMSKATIADLLKPLGYATGQFGKSHFGDMNHFNAEEEPEQFDYPHKDQFPEFPPRHEPASFTIDHAVKALQKFLAKD
jgi:arylsulfatase A-like enzyme